MQLWDSRQEKEWQDALDRYWDFVMPENVLVETAFRNLDIELVNRPGTSSSGTGFLRISTSPLEVRPIAISRCSGHGDLSGCSADTQEEGIAAEYDADRSRRARAGSTPAHIAEGLAIAGAIDGLGPPEPRACRGLYALNGSLCWRKSRADQGQKASGAEASHPSPRSAYRSFFGCRHFKKANVYLIKHGLKPACNGRRSRVLTLSRKSLTHASSDATFKSVLRRGTAPFPGGLTSRLSFFCDILPRVVHYA